MEMMRDHSGVCQNNMNIDTEFDEYNYEARGIENDILLEF